MSNLIGNYKNSCTYLTLKKCCPQQKQTLQTTIMRRTRALASVPGKTQKATRVLASVSVTSEYLHDYLHKRRMH